MSIVKVHSSLPRGNLRRSLNENPAPLGCSFLPAKAPQVPAHKPKLLPLKIELKFFAFLPLTVKKNILTCTTHNIKEKGKSCLAPVAAPAR
jgi:hypothetical protein